MLSVVDDDDDGDVEDVVCTGGCCGDRFQSTNYFLSICIIV